MSVADLPSAGSQFLRRWITPITVSVALLALTTAILGLVEAKLQQDHLILIYLVPTALIAIRYGSISAMCVTVACTFAAAFFIYPPRFSLMVENPLDLMELVLFGLLALLASQVVSGFAKDRVVARRRERRALPPLRARWPRFTALWRRIARRR